MRPRALLDRVARRIVQEIESIPSVRRAVVRFMPTSATLKLRLEDVNRIRYEASPYQGRVHLFQATTPTRSIQTEPLPPPEVRWRDLVRGGLDVHPVPGSHLDVAVEPFALFTAEAIEGVLNSSGAGPSALR